MWRDIALGVGINKVKECEAIALESQNVQNKGYCDMTGVANAAQPFPIFQSDCSVAKVCLQLNICGHDALIYLGSLEGRGQVGFTSALVLQDELESRQSPR